MSYKAFSVFVVDDESIIAWFLAKILQHNGYRAARYLCPKQALEDAKADPPDLIMSDVLMPPC